MSPPNRFDKVSSTQVGRRRPRPCQEDFLRKGEPWRILSYNGEVKYVETFFNQMRKAEAILFRACYIARESATLTCILAETQRQAEEQESFLAEKEGFRCALIQGYLHGEALGLLTRSRAYYMLWLGMSIGFFWLVLS